MNCVVILRCKSRKAWAFVFLGTLPMSIGISSLFYLTVNLGEMGPHMGGPRYISMLREHWAVMAIYSILQNGCYCVIVILRIIDDNKLHPRGLVFHILPYAPKIINLQLTICLYGEFGIFWSVLISSYPAIYTSLSKKEKNQRPRAPPWGTKKFK